MTECVVMLHVKGVTVDYLHLMNVTAVDDISRTYFKSSSHNTGL